MAREAYRSLYGDLTKLKDVSLANDPAAGTGADTELFQLLLSATEWVDRWCNRRFYPHITTLTFDGDASERLVIPDLISVTTLKADENNDKTFEITWATTDYWLEPYNAEPTKAWGHPYTSIHRRKAGNKASFLLGEQNYEIAGTWGYKEFLEDAPSLIDMAAGLTATGTALTVDTGGDFAVGQTIKIESEWLFITAIAGAVLTVKRAFNGSTGATHADNTQVKIVRWPLPVERATLITAARLWTRAPAFEPFYVSPDVDPDVDLLLESYRRLAF